MAAFLFLLILLSIPAEATIQWVDFNLSCEAMERALALDMESREQDNPQPWIRILALAAARTGGNPKTEDVAAAYRSLVAGKSPKEILGGADVTYRYYFERTQPSSAGWWAPMRSRWTGNGSQPMESRLFLPLLQVTIIRTATTSVQGGITDSGGGTWATT